MCNNRGKDYRRMIEETLSEFGVLEFRFLPVGAWFKKHPCVEFVLEGKVLHHTYSSTCSDKKGLLANKTSLKKLCRLHQAPPRGNVAGETTNRKD